MFSGNDIYLLSFIDALMNPYELFSTDVFTNDLVNVIQIMYGIILCMY